MKLCVDCKYYYEGAIAEWCKYDDGDINPVNGKLKPKFAHIVRCNQSACGIDAKWFEEKEVPKTLSFFKRLFK